MANVPTFKIYVRQGGPEMALFFIRRPFTSKNRPFTTLEKINGT